MSASQRSDDIREDMAHAVDSDVAGDSLMRDADSLMRDAMWRGNGGYEIAFTPVLFGLAGWRLDLWLGTKPLFIVALALLGLVGAIANQYYRYREQMDRASTERRAALEASAPLEVRA